MDFKFVSHGLWSEKQNILLQHMHKKEFWILTNKCGNNLKHENEAEEPWLFSLVFDSRILRRSICESSLSLSVSISAFFCVLIASSLLCAPGRNRLDQSRTSLEDFSREPVRPVNTLDLLFICSNLHCKNCSAFIEKEFIPVAFLSYTCNYYNRLYLIVSTNFAISWFTDFIGSFVVSELSV